MSSRDFYNVSYHKETNVRSNGVSTIDSQDVLDNDTEFNANQFKLYDDFTTDLRIVNFTTLRSNLFQDVNSRRGNDHDGRKTDFDSKKNKIGDANDSGVDMENGNPLEDAVASNDSDLLENEVMLDPWSSMESSNSPLTDSGPSASEDCTPSTSSEPPRVPLDAASPSSSSSVACCNPPDPKDKKSKPSGPIPNSIKDNTKVADKASARDLTLDLETLDSDPARARRPHFLDEDYQTPSRSNIECRIPKPHFLDHSPSPDEFDERSDITNPNFLDDDVIEGVDVHNTQKKSGALPKRPQKSQNSDSSIPDERPHRTSYTSTLHYGLESAARSSERDKRASQLYRGTWPGEREVWTGNDTASVRSFSSNGSADATRPSSNLENKMECVYSLLSLLTLSPDNNADLSGPLLEMSRSVESCIAMRQAGCIPLLVQLIHSKLSRETRDRAAKALRNIIHTQTDDKAGRREARVWRLLEQVREYCYILENVVESRKEAKELIEDDTSKHPSQCVAALMKLSFDEEHRHVVCQLGGLQALAALVSGDQAAHGSRTDDNTCLTMRRYAGMTLTNLTFGDGNNKSLLCSFKDFMMALVEQLESPNDDMRQVTAAVLRNLSWRADTSSKQILREVGAVKGLTKAAMTCQKEATLKSVLSALWNLTAHCSMNKVALCSVDGALGFLVDMLSYNSPTKTLAIIENAGGIMRNVSSHIAVREDYRQILRERNCLSVLLQHLKSPSLTVVSNSCGTLWNLSARCPQDQQFLWDHGAVPMLRSLIHSKHKMIAMGSSAALKNLLNSKPGKSHIISIDSTARNMNLPALPTLGVRKQKALEQELDQNLAETCDNIEPATSPTTSNREEKNLFTATERQIAMNLERHRMTSSSPLMGTLTSQISLSHSAHLAGYLSCSNTLLKGALVSRSSSGSTNNVNRSDSKDSVTSTHSDSVFERVARTGKVPIPTPRNKDLVKTETVTEVFKVASKPKDTPYMRFVSQPPIPPPRSSTDMRTNYTESGYDVDQDSCDQPIDYSRKYSETKSNEPMSEPRLLEDKSEVRIPSETTKKYSKKESSGTFGDYQETDLDQPTDYSLRYAEHQSETGSDISEPTGPSVHEDTIKRFCTEGTPYETPIIFSTATSMSDLRVIGPKDQKVKTAPSAKENPEIMTHSDEKDTCSIEDPPRHDNDVVVGQPNAEVPKRETVFDTKFSSGMISPEKPVKYCEEGTPGYFSRVSSLSSLGEPTEEDCLAKKNAMATVTADASFADDNMHSSVKDKEASKAVTFASEPTEVESARATPPAFVEDTPLMFSRTSSLGSLPDCDHHDDQGSVVSEISRLTSGCISPSEIPDSPAHSVPVSPRPTAPHTPPQPSTAERCSVFEERVSQFVVENTPAHFSTATSLSELTIPDDTKSLHQEPEDGDKESHVVREANGSFMAASSTPKNENKGHSVDTCRVYFTEDTPAILSKAGSNSALSALSLESSCLPGCDVDQPQSQHPDTSDSSNLSDAGDLLEQCIQKGIQQVVKNKGQSSECSSVTDHMPPAYFNMDGVYHSLPPYLRSSTETVKMSHEHVRTIHDSGSSSSPPPPLPPKSSSAIAPPRPPLPNNETTGRRHESRLPIKTQRNVKEKPKLPAATNLVRNDSLSSLSIESFGSTDRELFEETVKAGLCSVNPRANHHLDNKSHSVERPADNNRPQTRQHKSLDRSQILQQKTKRDLEFERNLTTGLNNLKNKAKQEKEIALKRSPYSYHGDTAQNSLAHHSRYNKGPAKLYDEGPPSLPARIDAIPRQLERSNSLSSLSNESFGSTDKEVFERCVRIGMTKANPKKKDGRTEEKLRVRSDDRLEVREGMRSRRRRPEGQPKPLPGALDRMLGDEYSKDRAILEEVIARGAGEKPPKNVPAPSVDRASADGNAGNAHTTQQRSGSDLEAHALDSHDSALDTTCDSHALNITQDSSQLLDCSNELPTVDSGNTTFESVENEMERSNEFLAPKSVNTTLDSEIKDELNRSNESYADVLDGSWSDFGSPPKHGSGTLTRPKKTTLEWTDIKLNSEKPIDFEDVSSKKSHDTWNDNTCPDDVTFPTISGSVHMVASIRSEIADSSIALPDLLEKSDIATMSQGPDLTNKLDEEHSMLLPNVPLTEPTSEQQKLLIDSIPEPSFASLLEDSEPKFDSIMSSAIEQEAARLAAQLKVSQYTMTTSVTSLTSLDLDNMKPPSNLGSLLSLSTSGHWEDSSPFSKKSQKSRKKSLPQVLMVKRALSNSMHQGSSEHLDSNPVSLLENVKPPSEMDSIDMESSMISVASIASEVVEARGKTPVVFDLKLPIQEFPLCNNFNTVYHDLDKVNPPSLFDEMMESTIELEQTTAHQVFEDCLSGTLNVVTDIPSGSENCTPLPSDVSSVESTPKRIRNSRYLTPKEKRQTTKDRYQTYTITDSVTENDVVLEVDSEEFLTWTKSESDSRSDDYATASSEPKVKRRVSAKQRRQEDRARYQTQTVDITNILTTEPSKPDPQIESLKQRLANKKSMKQKRMEDAERFRTRTLSEDIPPSPTYVTRDVNFENVETTTGYDSLSSNELNQQTLQDRARQDDRYNRDVDSGNNEDDSELNSTQMQTYTRSFRNYLPVIESPAAVDLCVVNNLKNIEMTASYRRSTHQRFDNPNPSTSDFASLDGDSDRDDKLSNSDSESENINPIVKPKPKIIKPEDRRDESLDSNESLDKDPTPKAIRGRKKALYVSPYRRNIPTAKKPAAVTPSLPKPSIPTTSTVVKSSKSAIKAHTSAKTPTKPQTFQKPNSNNTSPKKTLPNKSSPLKTIQKTVPIALVAAKPLPIERQGTFTKEDSTVPARDLPMVERKTIPSRLTRAAPTKPTNTSPSRLPQPNASRFGATKPPLRKVNSSEVQPQAKKTNRSSFPAMKNSASNHSLQSNESGKTVTLASKNASRQGSTSSVNSVASTKTKEVESRIASLWKKVEQSKKQPNKPDRRVWIESDKPEEIPKLIRSSTFEGQPKLSQVSTAQKQKSAIAMRVSQIPLRPKGSPTKTLPGASKKPAANKLFSRKPINGQS